MESKKTTTKEVFVKVENLKVWTPEEFSWWRRKVIKPKTIILNNVSVFIKAGEFVAVIGPSGAGKTTFLVSVAGKCNLPSTGSVTISDTPVKDVRRGVVEILPQFDVFMDNISVKEHLVFMIEMKLGSTKKTQNKYILKVLLQELQLGTLEDSPISSLSGGERRLLSLATSLISSPQILICDEPTTGLDSYNASLVIGILKKLSLYGKIIICSVHQPSSDLFREFNSISLMAEGRMLFHGSKKDCKALFESLNLHCPVNYNPAEFYIKAVSMDTSNKNFTYPVNSSKNDCNYIVNEEINSGAPAQLPFICQRHWMVQVQLLLWRSSLAMKKNIKFYIIQIFISTIISSAILGTCYVGTSGTTQEGVQDFRGFLWLICSEVSFSISYYSLYAFESDLTLFKREAGVYTVSAFYVSRFLCWIPRCIVWPVVYVGLGTMTVQLPNHFLTAVKFVVILIVTAIASTAYGLGLGALFISTGIIGDVLPCADLPLILMSGAFLRISSLPFWLHPVKYMSHFYYGMDAMSNVYWRQIDVIGLLFINTSDSKTPRQDVNASVDSVFVHGVQNFSLVLVLNFHSVFLCPCSSLSFFGLTMSLTTTECPSNSTSSCLTTGAAVLRESGYSSNFVLEDTLGMLFVCLVWSLLGYIGLKREENKGYAY